MGSKRIIVRVNWIEKGAADAVVGTVWELP